MGPVCKEGTYTNQMGDGPEWLLGKMGEKNLTDMLSRMYRLTTFIVHTAWAQVCAQHTLWLNSFLPQHYHRHLPFSP
jgi:hypothetical protein